MLVLVLSERQKTDAAVLPIFGRFSFVGLKKSNLNQVLVLRTPQFDLKIALQVTPALGNLFSKFERFPFSS